jgi:hypothetical protein
VIKGSAPMLKSTVRSPVLEQNVFSQVWHRYRRPLPQRV